MKKDMWVTGRTVVAAAGVVAMVAGCASSGAVPAKKDAAGARTDSGKKAVSVARVDGGKQAPVKTASVPAKPRLPMPQTVKPVVAPVVIPAFDWQNAKVAPSNRAEVLANIDKKYRRKC